MRIALGQLNPTVGDVAGNTSRILAAIEQAKRDNADVLVTSELALIGYPPHDLLQREGVVESCENAAHAIASKVTDFHAIIGHPRICTDGSHPFYNSASVCSDGKVVATIDKQLLPGYDIFDEDRYFEPGKQSNVVDINGQRCGILICEDLWRAEDVNAHRSYKIEPVKAVVSQGCDLLIVLNASPFVLGKWQRHLQQLSAIASELQVPIVSVNQVGANDDLIFDGRSAVINKLGNVDVVLPAWEEAVVTVDIAVNQTSKSLHTNPEQEIKRWSNPNRETVYALALGIRDYCHKTGHNEVVIGLSGGIDSAVTAVIASLALGSNNVHGVLIPSKHTSSNSSEDARDTVNRLGLAGEHRVSIESLHHVINEELSESLGNKVDGITDENIQARLRGVVLMGISNASGALLISTSNKSEIATGYSTLYGDMCGAVAVLGDMTKTRVYDLALWINENFEELGFTGPPIPDRSITKPPSAELRPNQTDQDTLPPYEQLDQVIERYVDMEQSIESIVEETGFDPRLVQQIATMIDRAEYKRHQSPIIPKLTWRAFGRGRVMPIVMKQSAFNPQRLTTNSAATAREPSQFV